MQKYFTNSLKFILLIIISSIYFNTFSYASPIKIKKITPINLTSYHQCFINIPDFVTVEMTNKSKQRLTVKWNLPANFKETMYLDAGKYSFLGTVKGTSEKAKLTIKVYAIKSIEQINYEVHLGGITPIPQYVDANMEDGGKISYPVDWNWDSFGDVIINSKITKLGTYTLDGTIDGYKSKVKLNIKSTPVNTTEYDISNYNDLITLVNNSIKNHEVFLKIKILAPEITITKLQETFDSILKASPTLDCTAIQVNLKDENNYRVNFSYSTLENEFVNCTIDNLRVHLDKTQIKLGETAKLTLLDDDKPISFITNPNINLSSSSNIDISDDGTIKPLSQNSYSYICIHYYNQTFLIELGIYDDNIVKISNEEDLEKLILHEYEKLRNGLLTFTPTNYCREYSIPIVFESKDISYDTIGKLIKKNNLYLLDTYYYSDLYAVYFNNTCSSLIFSTIQTDEYIKDFTDNLIKNKTDLAKVLQKQFDTLLKGQINFTNRDNNLRDFYVPLIVTDTTIDENTLKELISENNLYLFDTNYYTDLYCINFNKEKTRLTISTLHNDDYIKTFTDNKISNLLDLKSLLKKNYEAIKNGTLTLKQDDNKSYFYNQPLIITDKSINDNTLKGLLLDNGDYPNFSPDFYCDYYYVYFNYAKTNLVISTAYDASELNTFEKKSKYIIDDIIKPNMTESEKVLAIHDFLIANCSYDYENYIKNTIPHSSASSHGVILNGTAVCSGYACAMRYLCNLAGVECTYVADSKVNHAWNVVKIEGEFYQIDATWNDSEGNGFSHNFYCLSDKQMNESHNWNVKEWSAYNFPKANKDRSNSEYKIWSTTRCYNSMDTNYIYYNQERKDSPGNYYITRLDKDGNEIVIVNSNILDMYPYKDYLYFIESNTYELFRINFDGSNKIRLNLRASNIYSIKNNVIYYTSADKGIFMCNLDGTNNLPILNEYCVGFLDMDDSYIYYYTDEYNDDLSSKRNIMKFDLLSKATTNISNYIFQYNKAPQGTTYKLGKYLVFVPIDGFIHTLNLETNKETIFTEIPVTSNFDLYKDYIYLKDSKGIWYRFKMDGTDKTKLTIDDYK